MEFKSESALREYAEQFWQRQRHNDSITNRIAFSLLDNGGDPARLLRDVYPHKMAHIDERDCRVCIMELSRTDLESLTVQECVVNGLWMYERDFRANTTLKQLANHFIETGYFNHCHPFQDDPQRKYYREWRKRGCLADVLKSDMPFIALSSSGLYKILDGWARLLPYMALLQEGFEYWPVECFLAKQSQVQDARLKSLVGARS